MLEGNEDPRKRSEHERRQGFGVAGRARGGEADNSRAPEQAQDGDCNDHRYLAKNFQHFAEAKPSVQNMNTQCSEYESKKELSSKNSRRDAKASADLMKNPFGYYCEVAKALRVSILPEDREQTSKHFKDLARLESPTEEELKRVVSKMLEARTAGCSGAPEGTREGQGQLETTSHLSGQRERTLSEQMVSTAGYRTFE